MHKYSELKLAQYAEDSTTYDAVTKRESLTNQKNCEVQKVYNCLCANELSLNVTKSFPLNSLT